MLHCHRHHRAGMMKSTSGLLQHPVTIITTITMSENPRGLLVFLLLFPTCIQASALNHDRLCH